MQAAARQGRASAGTAARGTSQTRKHERDATHHADGCFVFCDDEAARVASTTVLEYERSGSDFRRKNSVFASTSASVAYYVSTKRVLRLSWCAMGSRRSSTRGKAWKDAQTWESGCCRKEFCSLAVVRVRYKVLPPVERWPPGFFQLKYGITGMQPFKL
jgi:hypothetical protein